MAIVRNRTRSVAGLILAGIVCAAPAAHALTYLKPTPVPGDEFGRSIAAAGANVIVGADYDDTQAPENGVVYIFDANTAALVQTLLDPAPIGPVVAGFNYFGWSVAALGGKVLIGTPGFDISFTLQNVGRVYLFDPNTAALLQTYANPSPAMAADFGQAVAAVGGDVLVGAPGVNMTSGAAYLLDGTTGTLLQTFANPTPGPNDAFGRAVAAVGGNVLIGAPDDDTATLDAGAAYLFDATTGALLQTFLPPTPQFQEYFGTSVAAFGNDVLVGAPGDSTVASFGGAVYRFDATTGALLQSYFDVAPAPGEQMGFSVASVGPNVAAGALLDTTAGPYAGAVHVFDGATAAPVTTCIAGTPGPFSDYGFSVAALGSDVLVGARSDSIGAPWAGAAYRCALTPPSPCGNGVLDPGEQCDDGNTVSGDGCSSTCVFEPNFIDHYMCYQAKPTSPWSQVGVMLADQFETAPVTVKKVMALCPPADKNGEGILDPVTHQEAYVIKQTSPPHTPKVVTILDQFGSLVLKTRRPSLLMVPTNKGLGTTPSPPPPGIANHFKCYGVKLHPPSPPFTPVTVQVDDQFENRTYTVTKPEMLCNPVDKNGEGIKTPSGHLVCYRVTTNVKHAKVIGLIHTANQFGTGTLDTVREASFCVPALKWEQ